MYKHLFFDLDRTLWDFEKNSADTLKELYNEFKLNERGVHSLEDFIAHYISINQFTWEQYRKNEMDKDYLRFIRFHNTLQKFNVNDYEFAKRLAAYYVYNSPKKVILIPYAKELLDYLLPKYNLHIITNGFEEVQHHKIDSGKIKTYFKTITTSEGAKAKKPEKEIFSFALERAHALPSESMMIGDDLELDIMGGINAGIAQVYFNPTKKVHDSKPTHEIECLSELFKIL